MDKEYSNSFGFVTGGEDYQDHLVRFQRCPACSHIATVSIKDGDTLVSCSNAGCCLWTDPAPQLRDKITELENRLAFLSEHEAKVQKRNGEYLHRMAEIFLICQDDKLSLSETIAEVIVKTNMDIDLAMEVTSEDGK